MVMSPYETQYYTEKLQSEQKESDETTTEKTEKSSLSGWNITNWITNAIKNYFSYVYNTFNTYITNYLAPIYNYFSNVYNTIKNYITNVYKTVNNYITNVQKTITNYYHTYVTENIYEITEVIGLTLGKVEEWWKGKQEKWDNLWDTKVKQFEEWKKTTLAGIGETFGWTLLFRDSITEFFTDPDDWLYKAVDRIIERYW